MNDLYILLSLAAQHVEYLILAALVYLVFKVVDSQTRK